MDDETRIAISGALTAQRFIMENIYALILAQDPNPVLAAQRTGAEMLRQFEDVPSTNDPAAPQSAIDEGYAVIQHGVHHLERFWIGVERRLAGSRRG